MEEYNTKIYYYLCNSCEYTFISMSDNISNCPKCNSVKINMNDYVPKLRKQKVPKITENKNILINKYFHSLKDGEIYNQGQVLGKLNEENYYLVQLFSFLDGSETRQIIVPFLHLIDYYFYSTAEDMQNAYDKVIKNR